MQVGTPRRARRPTPAPRGRTPVALAATVLVVSGALLVREADREAPRSAECAVAQAGVRIDPAGVPGGPVAGYRGEQLANAAAIVNAGEALGLDTCAQTIGVMTAMGESSLRVLDRGDAVGPDSRGLFQQRANGAWGSYADRMDPTTSAVNFFRALQEVPDWQALPPTIAAHRTQRNADPHHYARYWDPAVEVVTALAGRPVTGA
ncbi:hypothetical protein SAMN05660350_01234 [Geodermatophilus obscurus]|uniref:Peptidase M23 n=1 Tax=Geodermatophilus obscurus TaxID=1861 RepID=A0A1M7T103_9ACTN|nr:hypothetical protein [Geodermatophilus obscurus]SHN64372.1 hypothetical protein SAMN05660350_01234 [Geodermatophilus obscurus]